LLLLVHSLTACLHHRVALLLRTAVVGRLAAANVPIAGRAAARGVAAIGESRGQQHREHRHAQ